MWGICRSLEWEALRMGARGEFPVGSVVEVEEEVTVGRG